MEYVENRIAIAKLEAKQKIADVASTVAAMIPALLFGLFALTFLSLTLAQAINVWLDSRVWGFLIVGVMYGIAAYVMFSQRNAVWLKKKIVDGSTKFLKDNGKSENKADSEQEATYNNDAVEHRKIVFDDTEGEPAETETDVVTQVSAEEREYMKDRKPVSRANGNAAIIVESETEEKQSL